MLSFESITPPSAINARHRLATLNEFRSSRSKRRSAQLVSWTISGPISVLAEAGTSQICLKGRISSEIEK